MDTLVTETHSAERHALQEGCASLFPQQLPVFHYLTNTSTLVLKKIFALRVFDQSGESKRADTKQIRNFILIRF